MKVQRLQIEQQLAEIRVDSQMARLSVQMPKRTLSVQQPRARMSVQRQDGSIELDMEEFRNNIGLKSISALAEESAARAQASVRQSIQKFASEADYIGTLPAHGNPIAQIARSRMLEPPAPETDGGVPPGAIKMEGRPGRLRIDWSKQELKLNWNNFEAPVITVEPKPSVSVHIVQEPSVEFTVVEMNIPAETGETVDEQA